MEISANSTNNKKIKEPKIKLKNIVILAFSPIPNFFILYYYIICCKIIIENQNEDCNSLNEYNISSLILHLLFNIYLMCQLCVDSTKLFFHTFDKTLIYQGFLFIFLALNILYGAFILREEDDCQDENKSVYILSVTNFIIQTVIFIILFIYWFYLSCKNETSRTASIIPVEEV